MAATLVAARGLGSAPAWGPEAITPDWEGREVSTGVRRHPGFRRCAQTSMRWEEEACVGLEHGIGGVEVV